MDKTSKVLIFYRLLDGEHIHKDIFALRATKSGEADMTIVDAVEILEPEELQAAMREKLEAMLKLYKKEIKNSRQ